MLGVGEEDLGTVPLFLSQENRSGSGEGSNRYIPGVFLLVGDFTTAYHVRATRIESRTKHVRVTRVDCYDITLLKNIVPTHIFDHFVF